ncbi:MAG: V-type ATP synthase subunit D [Ruminiclostridium sp.]|nr:V-type ATP synthase subunit D [Ruminiclostridium sp.]MBQ8410472.1 V-type ATP synthase subunit D [Ruminiclostridium sp.]MBQ8841552.1 V-type ATP synthase subunit D [Ruminiclostridium sp.]
MAQQVFATKGNLINARRSLKQAQLGYELMDRKRNILIREMVSLSDAAKELKEGLENTFNEAYSALRTANIVGGVINVEQMPVDTSIEVSYRSVMGVELPTVTIEKQKPKLRYVITDTNTQFDKAYISFIKAKEMSIMLAEIENSIYRLSVAIRKTQKRANALKNIVIPNYKEQVKFITNALEEKEREEFSRQKIIKATMQRSK